MDDYPETWNKYHNEISLPVYFNLTDEQVKIVLAAVEKGVNTILG
jgi:dTDP-4-amino-4,6-dideoxygalactose transaminase